MRKMGASAVRGAIAHYWRGSISSGHVPVSLAEGRRRLLGRLAGKHDFQVLSPFRSQA